MREFVASTAHTHNTLFDIIELIILRPNYKINVLTWKFDACDIILLISLSSIWRRNISGYELLPHGV